MSRVAGRFGRVEPRRTVGAYDCGLLANIDWKYCWNLAEHSGYGGAQMMQRLPRAGTPMPFAMTCVTTSSSSSATRAY